MFTKLILPEVEDLIERKNWNALKEALSEIDVHDIAELLENLDEQEAVIVFRLVPREKTSDVFAELDPSLQEYLLEGTEGTVGRFVTGRSDSPVRRPPGPDDPKAAQYPSPGGSKGISPIAGVS